MFRTKRDVDRHVSHILNRIRDEKEVIRTVRYGFLPFASSLHRPPEKSKLFSASDTQSAPVTIFGFSLKKK